MSNPTHADQSGHEQIEERLLRWQELRLQGQSPSAEDLCAGCPELTDALRQRIEAFQTTAYDHGSNGAALPVRAEIAPVAPLVVLVPFAPSDVPPKPERSDSVLPASHALEEKTLPPVIDVTRPAMPNAAAPKPQRSYRMRALAGLAILGGVSTVGLLVAVLFLAAMLKTERFRTRQDVKTAEYQEELKRRAELRAEGQRASALQDRDRARRQSEQIRQLLEASQTAVDRHSARAADSKSAIPGAGPALLYDLARIWAVAAAHAYEDRELPADQQRRLADAHAARAVQLLERAQMARYFADSANATKLRTDKDLDPLRTRSDFQSLLARVARGAPQ